MTPCGKKYLKREGISSEYSMEIQCIVLAKPGSQELRNNKPGKCWVIFFKIPQFLGDLQFWVCVADICGVQAHLASVLCGQAPVREVCLGFTCKSYSTPRAAVNQESWFKVWYPGDMAPLVPCPIPEAVTSSSDERQWPRLPKSSLWPSQCCHHGATSLSPLRGAQGPVPQGLTPSVLWL